MIDWHARLADRMWTIDEITDNGQQLFDRQLSQRIPDEGALTSWLIGWSERYQSCRILQFDSRSDERIKQVRAVVSHELDDDNRTALEKLVASAHSPRQVDTKAFGLTLLEAQRRIPAQPGVDGRRHFRIGGYVVQSDISRGGIRHETIHYWPDRLGEAIDPFGLSLSTTA